MESNSEAETSEENIRKLFQVCDVNGCGAIDKMSLLKCTTLLNLKLTDCDIENLYRSLDTDHDGVISFEEFASSFKFWYSKGGENKEVYECKISKRGDCDGDVKVNSDDIYGGIKEETVEGGLQNLLALIKKEKKDLEASYEKIEKEKYEMLFFYNERFIETERGYKKLNELLENEKKENAWLLAELEQLATYCEKNENFDKEMDKKLKLYRQNYNESERVLLQQLTELQQSNENYIKEFKVFKEKIRVYREKIRILKMLRDWLAIIKKSFYSFKLDRKEERRKLEFLKRASDLIKQNEQLLEENQNLREINECMTARHLRNKFSDYQLFEDGIYQETTLNKEIINVKNKSATTEITSNASYSPTTCWTVWLEDKDCKFCLNCGQKFNLFFRRHHCRRCGGIFCKNCSSKFIPLPELKFTSLVRVCNFCFKKKKKWKVIK